MFIYLVKTFLLINSNRNQLGDDSTELVHIFYILLIYYELKFSKIKNDQQKQTDINYLEFSKKLMNDRSIQQLIHYLNQTENIFMHFILRSNDETLVENELKIVSIRCKFIFK